MLSLVGDNPETWPQYVDAVLYSLRTTVIDPLGYTPHELMFGREPKLLLDVGNDVLKTHPSKSVRRYMAELRTQMNIIHDAARKTEEKQKEVMKRDYDKRSKPYTYQEGDRVWIRSPHLTAGSTKHFRDKFVGPYILCQQTSENTFKVRREDSQVTSDVAIHSDRFKPCISRYAKPSYMPSVTDEHIVGPELPLDLCKPEDYTEEHDDNLNTNTTTDDMSTTQEATQQPDDNVLDTQNQQSQMAAKQPVDTEFYPVERVIRGKYTPDGIKYLIKWKGYSSKHNTWEKESDLNDETLKSLQEKPVRIFGKKPPSTTSLVRDLTELVHDKLKVNAEKKDQESSDVDHNSDCSESDSDNESIYKINLDCSDHMTRIP